MHVSAQAMQAKLSLAENADANSQVETNDVDSNLLANLQAQALLSG